MTCMDMFDQCAWPDTSLTNGLHHSPPFAGFVKVITNLPDIINFNMHHNVYYIKCLMQTA